MATLVLRIPKGAPLTYAEADANWSNLNAELATAVQQAAIGVTVQGYSAILAGTTASFTTADETKLDGLVTNATHTGDATGATALTLATVNANVGSFGSATQVSSFTVNAKGLTTAAANVAIAIPASSVTDFATAVAATAAVTANTAKVTNATHTGDVTGATALTIAADVVSNAKLANMGANTIKGAVSAGDPVDLTPAQVRTMINVADGAQVNVPTNLTYTAGTRVIASDTGTDATLPLFTSTDAGLAPASGGGTTNFLRADGTWAAAGGGSPVTVQDEGSNVTTALATLNFTGAGVTVTGGATAVVNIPGGGGGGGASLGVVLALAQTRIV